MLLLKHYYGSYFLWQASFFFFCCSVVSDSLATPWTITRQVSLSMGFLRQEHWSGLPFPSPGDLPHPAIEPESPALQKDDLPTELWGKPGFLSNHLSPQSCDEFLEEQDPISPSYIVGVRNIGQHSRVIEKLTCISFFMLLQIHWKQRKGILF